MSFSEDYLEAHKHTTNHRAEVEGSAICGCFFCLSVFPPSSINRWLSDGSGTALCAECQIDSVLGEQSGFPVSDREFLGAMHAYWFERAIHVAS